MTTDSDRILWAVRDLAPSLAARADEIESARTLPPDLVHELTSLGLFRMLVPRSHGGLEIDFPTSLDILTELAVIDGALGWTVMIGSETPQLFALLPRNTFDQIYAGGPDVICAGAFAPQGNAQVVDGGYRINGRWAFASGSRHAAWLFARCIVMRDGKPAPGFPEGSQLTRCAVMPTSQWQILDTWRTLGMRGTGSNDITIKDAFVADDWTFDLFFGQPCLGGALFASSVLQFSIHIGAVALGIAEGALRDLIALASTNKQRLYARGSMADSPLFQYRLGHAEVDAQAARALLHMRAQSYWKKALDGSVSFADSAPILQTVGWVVETCARVVDVCYTAGGGTALYDSSQLQRRLRDIHTLSQHASTQESVFANAGAVHLGRTSPFSI
jgi:alkylation response protein AidB-like acyl-CoA dehydrogenase